MGSERTGQVAVIFTSRRTAADDAGYAAAAEAMDRLAAQQPGYRGVASARGEDGVGITISYWADEASAFAWRNNTEHAAIRDLGRARWYDWYTVEVVTVDRAYDWRRG
jgi:heme-degrading monooxygenase HmoA